jgi:hypothetical protein
MPGRNLTYQQVQIGAETTPATGVAAPIKLASTQVLPRPSAPSESVKATGQRGTTDVIVGKTSTDIDISGFANASDLFYWISSAIGEPTISSATATWKLNQYAEDVVSFTMEYGRDDVISKFVGARVGSLSLSLSPTTAPTFSGTLVARGVSDTGSMTEDAVQVPQIHFGPRNVSVWIANSAADLTNTTYKLSDEELLAFDFSIDGLVDPTYGISDTESWAFLSDTSPNIGATMSLVRLAKAVSFHADMLAHTKRYCRIYMVQGTNTLDIRFAFKFKDPGGSDNSGQYCADFGLEAVYDSTLATVCQIAMTASWINGSDAATLVPGELNAGVQGVGEAYQYDTDGEVIVPEE